MSGLTEAEKDSLLNADSRSHMLERAARIKAQARIDALREAAVDLRDNAGEAWGAERSWFTTGGHVANLAASWVDGLADEATR